jgi:hypothetical protein
MLLATIALGVIGCGGSTPRDIRYGTDAEADFMPPPEDHPAADKSDTGTAANTSDASDAGADGDGGDAAQGDADTDGAGN